MSKIALSVCVVALLSAGQAAAVTINEAGDSGETLATAQSIVGPVSSIIGNLTTIPGAGDASPAIDDIDLYSFFISDTAAFSVTVTSALSEDNDGQLFLFNSNGTLALDNDDFVGLVPGFAAGVLSGFAPGNYYLAYTLFNSDPIFTANALSGWNRRPNPLQDGPYTLTITGANQQVAAVPEPATWGMMLLGFGLAGFGLRRRKAVAGRSIA
jgi:opacity protein-like surface antigen